MVQLITTNKRLSPINWRSTNTMRLLRSRYSLVLFLVYEHVARIIHTSLQVYVKRCFPNKIGYFFNHYEIRNILKGLFEVSRGYNFSITNEISANSFFVLQIFLLSLNTIGKRRRKKVYFDFRDKFELLLEI